MVKPSVARDVTEATADAWVSEPALGEEQSRWSASASTWRSWNRMSPEQEFCEFVAAVVRLVKPELVIETGVGQGFTTRRIAAALASGSVLKGFESDDAWRERLARAVVLSRARRGCWPRNPRRPTMTWRPWTFW